MKIHTGDLVTVIAGKDKGKQGTVVRVLAEKNRVIVEGINMRVRHIKKNPQQAGQRISFEASIHASNIMILDPKSKKPTRIGFKIDDKGNKKRVARSSGEVIVKAVTKAAKPAKKTDAKAAATKEASAETKTPDTSTAAPAKQPFWKRKEGSSKNDSSGGNTGEGGGTSFTAAHRSQGG